MGIRRRLAGRIVAGTSLVLLMFVTACHAWRWDACAAITIFPPWVWLFPALVLAIVSHGLHHSRWIFLIVALWLSFSLSFADTPLAVVRGGGGDAGNIDRSSEEATIRIVTLNCASHSTAVAEAMRRKPDILLLQESPGRERLATLCHEMFGADGEFVWGADCSIVARGEIGKFEVSEAARAHSTWARVRLGETGDEVIVASLRLNPVPLRFDLWNPDCWRAYANNRRKQRRQLREVMAEIDAIPKTGLVIIGGDFNAPPGDAIFRLMKPRMTDGFEEAGVGWGNTILNDYPLSRIDRIWVSDRLRARMVVAKQGEASDHRMVVGEFTVDPPATTQQSTILRKASGTR